jgi:serine protease Do
MGFWKAAAAGAALLVAGVGSALLFPTVHAQSASRAVAPRALQVLAGRGSQIGVTIRDVDENDAKAGKMTQPSGVVIEEVAEDSPASKAGLKKGDIVVEFDGERVRSVRQFTRLVQETPAGRNAQAAVVRDGQKLTITVEPREGNGFNVFGDLDPARVIGDMAREFRFDGLAPPPPPPAPPARPGRPAPPEPPAPPAAPFPDVDTFIWRSGNGLGITVGDLSDQLAGYFGVKDGVLVTSITDDSAAAKAGIKAGDVITSFNGTDVTQPGDLRRRIQRLADGDEFTVGVVRDKKPLTLKGKSETMRSRRTYRTVI